MQSYAPPKLNAISILIADGDMNMSGIVAHMLSTMGFSNVTRVSNGRKALELLRSRSYDIIVTEWSMEGMDGMSLVQFMRDTKLSPNLTIPIVMMTGRAEKMNVRQARDHGVTEFLVKPLTTALLYDRIRRLFDHPRDFVIANSFVGPDRRHQKKESADTMQEKRVAQPIITSNAAVATGETGRPIIVTSRFELRSKARVKGGLETVITPDLLKKADAVIDSYKQEANQWIFEDLSALEQAILSLKAGLESANIIAQQRALSLKSRAGTFGYNLASSAAFSMYAFLFHDYTIGLDAHQLIAQKHLDVIKVLLAADKIGATDAMQQELLEELLKMTAKLKNVSDNSSQLVVS
jgi:two-component system, chemotaxis family, chemotaxis protein CheY